MTASNRVARRREQTRQRIVESAMALFLTQGYEETTVAQITEAADIGKGTFFTYFPTKQDVLSFLGEQIMQVMVEADNPELSAAERLKAIFNASASWYSANDNAARQMVLARIPSAHLNDTSPAREQLLELFRTIVVAGRSSREFVDYDLDAELSLVLSAYFVPVIRWATQPNLSIQELLAKQLELALKALNQ